MEYIEIASVILLGVLIQFVAAVLGPRVLHASSVLLILAAAAVTAYLAYTAVQAKFAGIGVEAQDLAMQFGGIAAALIITHLAMRSMFRCLARCSAA